MSQFKGKDLYNRLSQEREREQGEKQHSQGNRISHQALGVDTLDIQDKEIQRIQRIVTDITGREAVTPAGTTYTENIFKPAYTPLLAGQYADARKKAEYRTRRIRAIPSHKSQNVALRADLGMFLFVYTCVLTVSLLITGNAGWSPLQVYTTIAWTLYFPIAVIGITGAFAGRHLPPLKFRRSIAETVIFMVPSVVRDDTLPALIGVIDSILASAPAQIPNFLVQVVVDEGAPALERLVQHYREIDPEDQRRVWYTIVPKEFKTKYRTLKKARANHYAMLERAQLGLERSDIFIFHLDDDTRITPQTAMSIADFVANKSHTYYAAQGALAFPFQLTRSWFCSMMDSVRGGDDLLRFQAALLRFGGPIFGFHGENLLVNSVIEASIGWDFGPVYVEDAYFALTFMLAYPKRATFLQSCTYGGSPETIGDMIIQRRRWSHGLFGLLADRKISWKHKWLMGYAVVNWALGIFQHAGIIFLIAILFGRLNTSPVATAFVFIWGFNLAYQIWMYLTGLSINLRASQAPPWQYYVYPWLITLLMPIFSFIEALAAMLGFYDFLRGSKEFRVIKKSVS